MVARILILVFLVLTSVRTLPSQEVLHFEMVGDFPAGIVYGEFAPGEPDRIYLTCLGGRVLIFDISTGQFVPEPFFQIDLSISGEGGLFSLVFHPDYQTNGRLFVCFTDSDNGNNVVVDEYRRTGPNRAERADQPVIVIERPPTTTPGHNGGWMDFGKDGYLYISVGEMNPVFENSQLIDDNLKGAILRIDVNGDDFPVSDKRNYAIPPDNPLVGLPGDDEILAYGIRNAWRCSFDSDGNLFVADLQGSLREEINVIPAGHQQALNFGWPFFEGTLECPLPFLCDDFTGQDVTSPIFEYEHSFGNSGSGGVIGGYVYQGSNRRLQGQYFYADFRDGFRIRSFTFDGTMDPNDFNGNNVINPRSWQTSRPIPDNAPFVVSFFEDLDKNLYLVDSHGRVFRMDSIRPVGDFNGDNTVDLLDIGQFIEALNSDDYLGLGDINNDLRVDVNDIAPFVNLIQN